MQKRRASEDSDSDSLPDLNEVFQPRSSSINAGDIVWAKFKHLYWPALVRACYPSQKKISIWYCDEPGKTFKLPLKNVCLFYDKDMCAKIKKEVKQAGVLKEHEGLTSHANTYLRRKAEGYQDDPLKFFDQTYPYFLVEEMLKKDPSANVSDIKIPPMYISNEKKQTIRKRVCTRNNESDDSELESEESDNEIKKDTSDYISEVHEQLKVNSGSSSKEIDIDEIINYILSGKVDEYLKKIKTKKNASEHRDLFEQSLKGKGKNINEVTFTGPINDDDKLRKLIFYLLPLFEKIDNAPKRKSKTATTSSSSFGAQYVASVFLPESIIYAISKIKDISLADAKKLFIGKSECKTKAIESILKCVDSCFLEKDAFECVEKNVLQYKEQHESLSYSADTVEIMGIDKSDYVCEENKTLATDLKDNLKAKSSEVSSSEDEYGDEILNYILSGKVDDYLKKIKFKAIQSKYLDIYEQSLKRGKKKLSNVTYTGPLKDGDKLKKLLFYLLPLYDDANTSQKSKRSAAKKCKSAMAAYYISEKNPALQYVIYVWLPEAITFAISEIKSIDLSEAKKLFDEYVGAKAVLDILKLLDQEFSG